MKAIVIYDSISGNTKKIAQAIHTGIRQTGEPCDIVKIKDAVPDDLKNYDLIGLGSPVMHRRELYNITDFIEYRLNLVDGKHAFVFCTHGAFPGHYLSRVVPALIQRGMTVIGWNDWFCSVYYPIVPKPYFTDGHPDDIDLKEAEDFGREMVERSRRIYGGETHLIPTLSRGREYDEIYDPLLIYNPGEMPSAEALREFFKVHYALEFKVNKEKCNYPRCTICIDNCPMDSIDFTESPPVFNINCDKCFLCEQTCPRGAIEIDWEPYNNAHLPLIPPLQKSLEIFEARGRFRRLVPLDKIGWDTFLWKNRPPRLKIG